MLLERSATPGAVGALRDWLRLLTGAGGGSCTLVVVLSFTHQTCCRANDQSCLLLGPAMTQFLPMQRGLTHYCFLLPRQAPECCRWR